MHIVLVFVLTLFMLVVMVMNAYGEEQPVNRVACALCMSAVLIFLWSCLMYGEGRKAAFKQLGYHEVVHPQSVTVEKIAKEKKQ